VTVQGVLMKSLVFLSLVCACASSESPATIMPTERIDYRDVLLHPLPPRPTPLPLIEHPVETPQQALFALYAHLSHYAPCRAAREVLTQDFAAGKFAVQPWDMANRWGVTGWEVQIQDPNAVALSWVVQRSNGQVLPSIEAGTYYESVLLAYCHRSASH